MKATRNSTRLSSDAIYNLHDIAFDSKFVKSIRTFPDLEVIIYDDATMAVFKSLLGGSDVPVVQLSYDTTFKLGDFYLSVLLFRETEFVENPVIPLAYLMHERKFQKTHEEFFRHVRDTCPEIEAASNVIFVTDQELAINQSIAATFPSTKSFLCWNHVLQVC